MNCPKCNGDNITIQMIQDGAKTKHKGAGFGGHMNNLARGATAVCTLGMSNLVWKKSKGGSKTVMETHKVCLCQNCGYSWELEE